MVDNFGKTEAQDLLKSLSALSLLMVTANCALVVSTVSHSAVRTWKRSRNNSAERLSDALGVQRPVFFSPDHPGVFCGGILWELLGTPFLIFSGDKKPAIPEKDTSTSCASKAWDRRVDLGPAERILEGLVFLNLGSRRQRKPICRAVHHVLPEFQVQTESKAHPMVAISILRASLSLSDPKDPNAMVDPMMRMAMLKMTWPTGGLGLKGFRYIKGSNILNLQ